MKMQNYSATSTSFEEILIMNGDSIVSQMLINYPQSRLTIDILKEMGDYK